MHKEQTIDWCKVKLHQLEEEKRRLIQRYASFKRTETKIAEKLSKYIVTEKKRNSNKIFFHNSRIPDLWYNNSFNIGDFPKRNKETGKLEWKFGFKYFDIYEEVPKKINTYKNNISYLDFIDLVNKSIYYLKMFLNNFSNPVIKFEESLSKPRFYPKEEDKNKEIEKLKQKNKIKEIKEKEEKEREKEGIKTTQSTSYLELAHLRAKVDKLKSNKNLNEKIYALEEAIKRKTFYIDLRDVEKTKEMKDFDKKKRKKRYKK